MNDGYLDRLEQLFHAAYEHPPDERAAFLDAACSDEPTLRREVESLLRADAAAEAEGFLKTPAARIITRPTGQQVQFCTAPDDVRIAFSTVGQGPPLVKAANWLSHLQFDWASPVWRHWLAELSRHHTLVRYDERGCGLSDWDVGPSP